MQLLLKQVQYQGDQKAFKKLYELLFVKLYQFSFSYMRSKEVAEEIVNDVFLTFWQKRATLDSIGNMNVYLYVAVKNACLNHLRKNNLSLPVSLDDLTTEHLQITVNPETLLISLEMQAQVQEAIEQLPPRCRMIFKLVKEDGLSYKEVAAILDVSPKTIDSQLCIAIKKLSGLLQQLYA